MLDIIYFPVAYFLVLSITFYCIFFFISAVTVLTTPLIAAVSSEAERKSQQGREDASTDRQQDRKH